MNLLGAFVRHATFGEGTILSQSGNYLDIAFADGKKEFLYPKVFSKYITAVDPKIAVFLKAEVTKFEATEAAISESNRLQRTAEQAAHRDAVQKASAKPKKKAPAKAMAKEMKKTNP